MAGVCQRCWLAAPFCICDAVAALGPLRTSKIDVHIAVHYKEYGRSTATAKLLPLLAPASAQLHQYPEAQARPVERTTHSPSISPHPQ